MRKRLFSFWLVMSCLGLGGTMPSMAEEWPDKPIKLIVGTGSGGGPDVIARIIGTRMAERLGQSVVIDLRPGAGGLISADAVAKSPPDGNTWLLCTTMIQVIMPQIKKQLPYDPMKDFTPISTIGTTTNVLVVGKHLQVNDIHAFIQLAKSQTKNLTYGTAGIGSPAHLAGELLASMLGVKMTSISYKGATQALTDVAGGQVDWMITSPAAAKTLVQSGKVKLLATTGLKRDPQHPQLPAVAEALPGFEITQWWGIMVPSKTPQKIVDRIHKELMNTLQEPATQQQILQQGGLAYPLEEKEFAQFILKERQKYAQLIRSANITPEN